MTSLLLGACVDILVNNDDVLQGIYIQDEQMRQVFKAYPELLCVDATYKLLELRLPLYILLVEDGNGQSEVAAAFLLLEETAVSLTEIINIFKKHNPSWEYVRVIMSDKDITERDVFSACFPKAELTICLFHTFRSFRREIVSEKMGITAGQRNLCLEMVQQMAYSPTEAKYQETYSRFKDYAPSTVINYFDQQWHPIRQQWIMGMKYSSGNFLNTTNNRVESLNAKLKSVISRHSSLEEFVDKFFLVLRVLRSERDHKASLIVHKVPVIFHTTSDPAFTEYVKYLTPYAYKFVAKQMELKGKVKLPEMEASISCQDFNLNTSEGLIKVTPSTCQCGCWKSMRLPCRHILAIRTSLDMDLFDKTLCDPRWSSEYYKSNQRIFVPSQENIISQVSVVNVPAPKKRVLSQVANTCP